MSYLFHELRNPLNAIVGHIECTTNTLGRADLGVRPTESQLNEVRSDMGYASVCVDLVTTILNNVLDMSKIDDAKMVINRYVRCCCCSCSCYARTHPPLLLFADTPPPYFDSSYYYYSPRLS